MELGTLLLGDVKVIYDDISGDVPGKETVTVPRVPIPVPELIFAFTQYSPYQNHEG